MSIYKYATYVILIIISTPLPRNTDGVIQPSCRDVCKMMTWSDEHFLYKSDTCFTRLGLWAHGHLIKRVSKTSVVYSWCSYTMAAAFKFVNDRYATVVCPDSKVHGANMGPTWVLSAPGRPHVGLVNLAFWVGIYHSLRPRVGFIRNLLSVARYLTKEYSVVCDHL